MDRTAISSSGIQHIIDELHDAMLSFIIRISELNSGSGNAEGIRHVIDACTPLLAESGFTVSALTGNHLIARRHGARTPAILILGHMDTVYEKEHPFRAVVRKGDILRGPGVGDMKGGIALVLYSLMALCRLSMLEDCRMTVLFNSDEERGSKTSREFIEEEARGHDLVLVFEGGKRIDERTTFVIDRQGVGTAQFRILGTSHHAGLHHGAAVNVLEEMSHRIIELKRLADPSQGTTVASVGEIEVSDARRNVIPGWVRFNVDFRFRSIEERGRLYKGFQRIADTSFAAHHGTARGAHCELQVSLRRPPMIPHEETFHYAKEIERISAEIGHPMMPKTRPGGSDGCYTATLGITTLDGLGPVGDRWHTDEEYLEIPSLKKRMELFLRFWLSLFDGSR